MTENRNNQQLTALFVPAITIKTVDHAVGASIGIAMSDTSAASLDELLRRADAALYVSKNGGRGRYTAYQDDPLQLLQVIFRPLPGRTAHQFIGEDIKHQADSSAGVQFTVTDEPHRHWCARQIRHQPADARHQFGYLPKHHADADALPHHLPEHDGVIGNDAKPLCRDVDAGRLQVSRKLTDRLETQNLGRSESATDAGLPFLAIQLSAA